MSEERKDPGYSIERGQADPDEWQRLLDLAGSMGAHIVELSSVGQLPETDDTDGYINGPDFYDFAKKQGIFPNVAGRAYKGLIRIFLEQQSNPLSELSKLPRLQFDRLPDDLSTYQGLWDGSIGDLRLESLRQFVESFDELLAPATTKEAEHQICEMLPEGIGSGTIDMYRSYIEQEIDTRAK
jgi:hypothetical protein